jgi:hypothetical protein
MRSAVSNTELSKAIVEPGGPLRDLGFIGLSIDSRLHLMELSMQMKTAPRLPEKRISSSSAKHDALDDYAER